MTDIAIMRPGTFTSAEGNDVTFTVGDLANAAEAYDRRSDPAPIVVGHPKTSYPAYGWVKRLRLDGDRLVAETEDVAPELSDAVKAGHYRKVSAQFYPPDAPGNPKPGRYYLRHVGFLGAAAPAVKGLGTVAFSAPEAGSFVSFASPMPRSMPNSLPTTITLPLGQFITVDEHDLADQMREVREGSPHLSFSEVLEVAGIDMALQDSKASFAEGLDASEAARLREFYRAKRISLLNPGVSLSQAHAMIQAGGAKVSFSAPYGHSASTQSLDLYNRAAVLKSHRPELTLVQAAALIQKGKV